MLSGGLTILDAMARTHTRWSPQSPSRRFRDPPREQTWVILGERVAGVHACDLREGAASSRTPSRRFEDARRGHTWVILGECVAIARVGDLREGPTFPRVWQVHGGGDSAKGGTPLPP